VCSPADYRSPSQLVLWGLDEVNQRLLTVHIQKIALLLQLLGVKRNVFADKSRDKIVGMVVVILIANAHRVIGLLAGFFQ